MFYSSSAQVYGLKHKYTNIETSPLDGITDYAKNKIIAEKIVKQNHWQNITALKRVWKENVKRYGLV